MEERDETRAVPPDAEPTLVSDDVKLVIVHQGVRAEMFAWCLLAAVLIGFEFGFALNRWGCK